MPRTSTETDAFLEEARRQYELDRQADADDRADAEADNIFAHADDKNLAQWEKKAKAARKKRPIIQWNRILNFVHQVTNDGRQNKPSIKINRGDEDSTAHTAEFYTARIRQIEYESNVDTAKDCARDQQVITGRGFLRVGTEWIPGTQKQRIRVDKVENQFSVIWDRSSRKYDRSDADRCFLVSTISKAEHIRRFGKDSVLAAQDFAPKDSSLQDWCGIGKDGEDIQIAEYWLKDYQEQTVPAADGQAARTEKVPVIKQYVIDGAQILNETTWLGSTIPIISYWGEESVVDGKRRTRSLHRDARDPQRSLNLAISNLFEQLGQQSKSPWMVPAGAIAANHENDWANVHVTPLGYLIYQQYDTDGRQLNQPTRNQWEPAIQALLETANFCIDGIKAAMGIFDASLGAKSNETAGIAIQRRQKQTEISNFHFPDNEARSNKYLGEVLVELIGKVDRPGSSVPIRTEDHKTHIVPIGQVHPDWKTGEMVSHDLMSGQYGCTVSTGPSYDNARQEKTDRDIALVGANPEMLYAIGGSMLRSDDSAGADERADAWEQYVQLKIPGMKFTKPGEQQQGSNPQQVAQMQQALQQAQMETQKVHQFAAGLHEQIQQKQAEGQLAIQLKQMDLAFQREKLAVEDTLGKLKVASVEGIAELEQQISILMAERAQSHAIGLQQQAQAHQADQQQSAQQSSADSQATALQHQAAQSDADRQAAAEAAETQATQAAETEAPTESEEGQ